MVKERKKPEKQLLVVVGLGNEGNADLLSIFAHLVATSGCTIVESKSSNLSGYCTLMALLSGTWNQIAKIENKTSQLEKQHGFKFILKRPEAEPTLQSALPYSIYVVGLEETGLTDKLIEFFSYQSIRIVEMNSHTYKTKHTSSEMFSLTMNISVPTDLHIADLRDRFMLFCDDLNLDAIMEPEKY